ncbi:sodium/calcium exchanger Calx isoform X2 [Tribolium castaneum]|uniref:sodium/calcium exchanger Calx isoform X2 n=1 Tax=Tribolium castaneum TaxID=7070 RepID=UPI00046C0D82|nr:PREDICTED: sodium/calcium exchanger 3 isoform X2 [Tribolium castaneum]|eukprot:XP_008195194.1 PREDICTED: sodium/calcium exchanger 3 isoform X2 [Tribolium castaneum]
MTPNNTIACSPGLMLPCWEPLVDVPLVDKVGRGLVYFLSMVYLFIGVSIISDRFMAAIEVITSQEREVTIKRPGGERHIIVVRMWNETVANLTLMALGSSAPEILLSVIEIYAKNFEAGELGPGTIVGSAAYNLFVIIALCVSVIPDGEVRKIKHLSVFFVTAIWSVFAYVWLYMILALFSPGVVEIWEGLLTFMFFPLTVLTAYAADRKMYKYVKKDYRMNRRGVIVQAEGDNLEMGSTELLGLDDVHDDIKQEYITTLKELRQQHPHADLGTLERMAHEILLNRGPKSRAFYRIQATRKLMGSGDLLRRISERAQSDLSEIKAELQRESGAAEFNASNCRVFFEPSKYTVLESCGKFEVRIARTGDLDNAVSVDYLTEDGTAQAGSDYIPIKGTLHFGPGDKEKKLTLEVIDDDVFEPDEHFYVKLGAAKPPEVLASPTLATVIILDDDHGGLFKFEEQNHELVESVGTYELKVVRCSGARGRVIVPFWTEDGTAKAGKEYEGNEGQLIFENNESEKTIPLTIIEEDSYEKDVLFYVQLGEPQMSGASLAAEAEKKRPEERTEREKVAIMGKPRLGNIVRAQIRIKESKEFRNTVDKLVQRANASLLIGTSSWKEQFIEAITVSASDDSDQKKPSGLDYIMHVVTLFWKILFAFVPPTDLCKGYLCFFVSILCIGVVTAVIGDVASHFGATLGIADSVTAVVFVALGTSVPDTFASKVAAIHDKHADASIGNVTGSNAVNVFLGIGVAWSIAAIYHATKGVDFRVKPGNLAFSVTIFCSEAVITIIVLLLRRSRMVGGELGGPKCLKYLTSAFLLSLWIFYLIMTTLEVYHVIKGF